jgi:hypothetical protein
MAGGVVNIRLAVTARITAKTPPEKPKIRLCFKFKLFIGDFLLLGEGEKLTITHQFTGMLLSKYDWIVKKM